MFFPVCQSPNHKSENNFDQVQKFGSVLICNACLNSQNKMNICDGKNHNSKDVNAAGNMYRLGNNKCCLNCYNKEKCDLIDRTPRCRDDRLNINAPVKNHLRCDSKLHDHITDPNPTNVEKREDGKNRCKKCYDKMNNDRKLNDNVANIFIGEMFGKVRF